MKKDTYIRVRCTSAEKKIIKTASENRDISMSEFMLTASKTQITKEDLNSVYGYKNLQCTE